LAVKSPAVTVSTNVAADRDASLLRRESPRFAAADRLSAALEPHFTAVQLSVSPASISASFVNASSNATHGGPNGQPAAGSGHTQTSYDPCAGKIEGAACLLCEQMDLDCLETAVPKSCVKGTCTTLVAPTAEHLQYANVPQVVWPPPIVIADKALPSRSVNASNDTANRMFDQGAVTKGAKDWHGRDKNKQHVIELDGVPLVTNKQKPPELSPFFSTNTEELLWLDGGEGGRQMNGLVPVEVPVEDSSSLDSISEENRACQLEHSLMECMIRLGSYGVRRLRSFSFWDIKNHEWERADWMKNPTIQSKRLLDVTLPMSHDSTSFEIFGTEFRDFGKKLSSTVGNQDFDIYQQLRLGIRALDLPVAYNPFLGHVYGVNYELTISLDRVLQDVQKFLRESPSEIIILDVRKSLVPGTFGTLSPLLAEDDDPTKLPGQMVHNLVEKYLGNLLATQEKLAAITSEQENAENPKISELVGLAARVIYFWEGQQVLCTTLAKCQSTPGWKKHASGQPFAFGPAMEIGTRAFAQMSNASNAGKVLEPLCMNPSSNTTGSNDAGMLVHLLKNYTSKTDPNLWHLPACYPPNTELPMRHKAPAVGRLDAYLSYAESDLTATKRIFAEQKEVYTHGEPLTMRSDAERVNYLLLTHYLTSKQHIEQSMNMVAMDFVHPAVVHKLIANTLGGSDCDVALLCLDSGGCFAADLHDEGAPNGCADKGATEVVLMDYAEDRWVIGRLVVYYCTYALWILVVLCCWWCHLKPKGSTEGNGAGEVPGEGAEGEPLDEPDDPDPVQT
jgi:hypothetical protein